MDRGAPKTFGGEGPALATVPGVAEDEAFDCAIVGGGPAGLTAAIYLARFRRRVVVLHDAQPRAQWIPRTRNAPGYPGGIEGPELLARLAEQAARFGITPVAARVTALAGAQGEFRLSAGEGVWKARRILLATGVHDLVPDRLRFLWPLVREGRVRLCPVCDAFELSGKRIAVLASAERAEGEARFLAAYSTKVTVLDRPLQGAENGSALTLRLDDGASLEVDALYVALGVEVHSGLAVALGARCDADGYLLVDRKQQTTVPGIYAAGDLVQSLSQISVAFGQAAIAASAIHRALTEEGRPAAPPETGRAGR